MMTTDTTFTSIFLESRRTDSRAGTDQTDLERRERGSIAADDSSARASTELVGPDNGGDAIVTDAVVANILERTLAYSREREYTGYDYFDGMSSRVLRALPVESKWLNIAVQEGIKRAPVNIRPLFLVERRQNFKGTALFALANAAAYDLTGKQRYAHEVTSLADWLLTNQSDRYDGFCGGHRHEMQQLRERRPADTPNVVTTSYAVKALLRAAEFDPEYARVARTADTFLDEALEYRETDHGATIKYHPREDGSYETINGTAVGARLYVDLYAAFGEERFRDRAELLLDHVVAHQEDVGGWTYRIPASSSHLSMDNHHNGFVIESLLRFRDVTGSDRHEEAIERALPFYRNVLFEPDGGPNWDEDSRYPKDIHAATQGIITFSMAGDTAFARSIVRWVLEELYAGNGKFYYQKRRHYTKRFTLMRWCQAWMAYALSHLAVGQPSILAVGQPSVSTAGAPEALDEDEGGDHSGAD